MKTRMMLLVAMLFVLVMTSGCSIYGANGRIPDLNNPSSLDTNRVVMKYGDRINVSAYLLSTKDESKKYFDDDLTKLGIKAIFTQIQSSVEGDRLSSATLNIVNENGNVVLMQLPISSSEIFFLLERPYLDKAAPWFLFTYGVGGIVSAVATKITNNNIRDDLEKNKLLSLGPIGKEAKGFLCFKVPESVMGFPGIINIVIQRGEKKLSFDLDVGK